MNTHKALENGAQKFFAGLISAVMLFSILPLPSQSYAQPADVCGDGVHSGEEECDDGNLVDGDGCSSLCLLEACGDGRRLYPEQCDDGNTVNGDGCSAACFLEFCGDGVLQERRDEQCDDGNRVSGDGCSYQCQIEPELPPGYCPRTTYMKKIFSIAMKYYRGFTSPYTGYSIFAPAYVTNWTKDETEFVGVRLKHFINDAPILCTDFRELIRIVKKVTFIQAPDPKEINPPGSGTTGGVGGDTGGTGGDTGGGGGTRGTREENIKKATEFLASATGGGIYNRLTDEGKRRLNEILERYEQGRGLNAEELQWIASLTEQIRLAQQAEEKLYTDLLKKFTSTDISQDVLAANQLLRDRLVDVHVPIAIQELERAVAIVARGALKEEVEAAVNKLKRQQVRIDETPLEESDSFNPQRRPIEVFAALSLLKEEAEAFATPSIPASGDIVRREVAHIREAMEFLDDSYDIDTEEVEALLELIEIRSATVDLHNSDRFVATVNRLIAVFQ